MNTETDKLLQDIRQAYVCQYISDLRTANFNEYGHELILQIPDEQYSIDVWNESASYILGRECHCRSVKEVKNEILKRP